MNHINNEEEKNKMLFKALLVFETIIFLFYFAILVIVGEMLEEGPVLAIIITISTVIAVWSAFYAFKIEVNTGYYECKNCHHRFVPQYFEALLAVHIFTTRYLRCPKCNEKTWCKKVMSK